MKLQTVAACLTPVTPLLRCPQCGGALSLAQGRSLICGNRHCFDLSVKGYANLAPSHNQTLEKYGAALFESRARIFAAGFYAPVAEALCAAVAKHCDTCGIVQASAQEARTLGTPAPQAPMPDAPPLEPPPLATSAPQAPASQAQAPSPPVVLDTGCGEGYYSRALAGAPLRPTVIGVDLSRDALLAAARQSPLLPYLVGDLTRLPLQNATVDALVDVLTPADYHEFARLLKPSGLLYKIIPAEDYLREVRVAVAEHLRGGAFSNARVIEHLRAHADVLTQTPIRYRLPVTPEQAQDFLRMTPMTFGLSEAQRAEGSFAEITVAMELLVCRMRAEP